MFLCFGDIGHWVGLEPTTPQLQLRGARPLEQPVQKGGGSTQTTAPLECVFPFWAGTTITSSAALLGCVYPYGWVVPLSCSLAHHKRRGIIHRAMIHLSGSGQWVILCSWRRNLANSDRLTSIACTTSNHHAISFSFFPCSFWQSPIAAVGLPYAHTRPNEVDAARNLFVKGSILFLFASDNTSYVNL